MNTENEIFVAEWTSYVFLCGIFYVAILLLFVACIHLLTFDNITTLLTMLSLGGGFTLWLARFKILITADYIDYRGGFSRVKRIEYSKVQKWFFGWVSFKNISRELPILRLVVQTDTETIVMNIKPFSRQCVQLLNATLTERCGEPKKQWGKMSSLSRRVLDQVLKK